jgi:thiol-disulfide isomerase/thioredoxin
MKSGLAVTRFRAKKHNFENSIYVMAKSKYKMTRYILLSFLSLSFLVSNVYAQLKTQEQVETENGLEWHTNLQEVHKLSKASQKPIFAFFTGSDWCGWCKRLQRDVFAKPEFVAWAKKNVILLELDFPRGKQLPPDLQQQNGGMQQALRVSGYPTVWLLYTEVNEATNSFNLNTLGSLGYPRSPAPGKEQETFLNEANRILAQPKSN